MHHIPPIPLGRPGSTPRKERGRRGIPPQHPLNPVRPRHAKLAAIHLEVRPHVPNSQVGLPLGRRLGEARVIPLALSSVNTCPSATTKGEKLTFAYAISVGPPKKKKMGTLTKSGVVSVALIMPELKIPIAVILGSLLTIAYACVPPQLWPATAMREASTAE